MIVLQGSADAPIIIALDDDSEIEITIVEVEGNRPQIIICADEAVSILRRNSAKA